MKTKEKIIATCKREIEILDCYIKISTSIKEVMIYTEFKNTISSILEDIKQLNEETRKDSVKKCSNCGEPERIIYVCDNRECMYQVP